MMNKRKIIIITSKFLHVFVQHIIDELPLDCDVEIVEYKCFQDIKQIYQQYESTSDGFMLSGKAALAALEKALPDHRKPAVSFGSDLVSMYRLLLKHFVEQRTLRTDRVIFDFLLPIQENATVSYFLHDMDFPSTNTAVDNWLATLDIGRLSSIEEETSQKIIRLWEQNQFDLLICQYSSIIPVLEQHNIPYIYCYPEKEVFQSLVETLLAQIELSFFRENLPAAITISGTSSEIGEKDRAQLKTALYALKAELALDMIFQETPTGFQLFTSAKYINYLTDHFQTSFLSVRLKEDYGFPVSVGYGIGKNITEARSHAEDALKESFYAKGSFVIDENGNLIGPLNRSHCVTIQKTMSEQLYRIAEQCKLSTLTIQKLNTILQITGTNKMTSQDLSEHLGVTLRNANRILNQLEKGGAATMVYSHSSTSKGRPVKVYELHFNSETL